MKITFLGDLMMDEQQIKLHKTGEDSFSFDKMIYPLCSVLGDPDHIVANLETPVTDDVKDLTAAEVRFNTPEAFLDEVKNSGVDIVSTANNHCLDRGFEGLKRTIRLVEEKGIINIGTHLNKNEDHYLILDDGNVKVGIVNATYGTNASLNRNYFDSTNEFMVDMLQEQELTNKFQRFIFHNNSGFFTALKMTCRLMHLFQEDVPIYERKFNNKKALKQLQQYIEECKCKADVVIAYLHFGGQFNKEPIELAHFFADKCFEFGADAIVGNHEHVIQKIDSGKNFCAYCLGNFLTSQGVYSRPLDQMAEYSIALTLDIEKNGLKNRYFTVFMSRGGEDGKIYNIPVYEFLKDNPDEKIEKEVNILLNRIYSTTDIKYQIKERYEV